MGSEPRRVRQHATARGMGRPQGAVDALPARRGERSRAPVDRVRDGRFRRIVRVQIRRRGRGHERRAMGRARANRELSQHARGGGLRQRQRDVRSRRPRERRARELAARAATRSPRVAPQTGDAAPRARPRRDRRRVGVGVAPGELVRSVDVPRGRAAAAARWRRRGGSWSVDRGTAVRKRTRTGTRTVDGGGDIRGRRARGRGSARARGVRDVRARARGGQDAATAAEAADVGDRVVRRARGVGARPRGEGDV
mmetsp:Transcript_3083/g.10208  ORF Transcript_3083/g.10208 Transcript_3083/m.10208 type:complete len:254 (+) Transcript_3083:262-1023(+)